jgi:hypothetical protein
MSGLFEKYGDMLEACGFRKVLKAETRKDAVLAVKSFYMFHRFMPSTLQFIEGTFVIRSVEPKLI